MSSSLCIYLPCVGSNLTSQTAFNENSLTVTNYIGLAELDGYNHLGLAKPHANSTSVQVTKRRATRTEQLIVTHVRHYHLGTIST